MTEPVRLAKRLAEVLACSRREAEQYIEGGWVTVDGVTVEEPQFRVLDQAIVLDKNASLLALTPVTMLLHKPAGYVAGADGLAGPLAPLLSAATQSPDDRSGIRPLKKHFSSVELVTPLATPATGLVVLTQDWRVTRKLREDARVMEHEVVVDVSGTIKPGGLERLNRVDHGFTYQGALLPPAKVSWQNETRLRFALKGEVPGQIAYMCESVGLQVNGMKRLRIGRVAMSQLQPGQWRYLLPHERF
ncbi:MULTISPECIES: rRNA pseudouridine synthase [unclassified Polaromonas]|uniref:rRNA pseudouridine synthase n=1 Tax=unclassified Polaromonas TaxID=2638319 RepID=UPI000F085D09|nr:MULTISPECIES: rRNA pseudouridine synthase [unclassified Polaromonas]AYQ27023.1 RNA-binding protein [Polaromonas sp. SP1]QGJ18131.1 RNA-binding protein [Polaromonas sp. Pch-P]